MASRIYRANWGRRAFSNPGFFNVASLRRCVRPGFRRWSFPGNGDTRARTLASRDAAATQRYKDIDVPPGRINEIVKGKRSITADTALRLGKYFGTTAEMWMNLQSEYDLRLARRRDWPKIEKKVREFDAA